MKVNETNITRITDFKNDLVFKYLLNDMNDERCYFLLKLFIEEITGIKCKEIIVENSELNPDSLGDKDMLLDIKVKTNEGNIINIEMQNSYFSKEHYYRFQCYGARLLDKQVNRGGRYYSGNVHPVCLIVFINDVDANNQVLIDDYKYRNSDNHVLKHNLISKYFVQIPFIDKVVEEKGLAGLTPLEQAIYVFNNGIKNDILNLNQKVVDIMNEKMNEFNEDEDRVLAAYQRQLVQMGRNEALKRAAEEGEAKGIVKGRKEGLVEGIAKGEAKGRKEGLVEGIARGKAEISRENAMKFFKIRYPNENMRWLENLTKKQYDRILDFLFENKSLDEIKKVIKD